MDYSQAAYFTGSQAYPFMGVPPLTPSHSTSGPSEDFTSPPELYSEFNDAYSSNLEGYPPGFNHGLLEHHGLPEPRLPEPHLLEHHGLPDPLQPAGVFQGPPTPPNNSVHAAQMLNGGVLLQQAGLGVGLLPKEELDEGANNVMGDPQSAEEGEKLTPTQHRRKAQNRAAQRAFRERKERHVKELEAKIASMEAAQQKTTTENEKLKRDLQKISTENEILRATSGGGSPGGLASAQTTGPITYSPTDFYSSLLAGHDNKTLNHRIVVSDSGSRLYDACATWEYIMKHQGGQLDLADISRRLRPQAKCDGQGPVFEERAILEAIELSMRECSDLLL